MEEMKELKEGLKIISWTYLPISKKKREEFLERVKEKVRYYKPRIEDKCKIDLGNVKVKDNKNCISDVTYDLYYQKAIENAWKQGRIPTKIDINIYFTVASITTLLIFLPIKIYESIKCMELRLYNNTIYVPFNFANRLGDFNFKERVKTLDNGVVHELSHILWKKIATKEYSYFEEKKIWNEGFATYCADEFFLDLYPKEFKIQGNPPKLYLEGKKRIQNLVEEYGTQIIMEVPKRWDEFTNSIEYRKVYAN